MSTDTPADRVEQDWLARHRDRTAYPAADNWPHLTYYDQDTQLSFYWNGEWEDGHVGISHGGYGEPILGAVPGIFPLDDQLSMYQQLVTFDLRCKRFVESYKAHVQRTPNADPVLLVDMTLEDWTP